MESRVKHDLSADLGPRQSFIGAGTSLSVTSTWSTVEADYASIRGLYSKQHVATNSHMLRADRENTQATR